MVVFKTKVKIGLMYGGNSFEHEVSKMTAKSILENIDRDKFEVKEIFIEKNGEFNKQLLQNIDAVFLAVHGPNCEDGTLQKFLEKEGIIYTGSGVKASKLNMDKVSMHKLFRKAGLKTIEFIFVNKNDSIGSVDLKVRENFGYPCFVKPNNTGSSVGIAKVYNQFILKKAINMARKFDNKIIVEKAINRPREIEISIIGNKRILTSDPGEVKTNGEIYSYDRKYIHPFQINKIARLSTDQVRKIKKIAKKAYWTTGCRGYARIDFFIDEKGDVLINEINTLPGFTKTSVFPMLIEAKGISYKNLITKIINLALE